LHGWQANKRHIYVWLLKIGLCPKNKSHPLGGWIFTLLPAKNSADKNYF